MDVRHSASSRKPWLPFGVTLALLVGLGALILWQWQALEQRKLLERQQRFELEAEDIGQRVKSRMLAYEMVLRGVSGLMTGSDNVSPGEWERALEQLQLQERYPGIQALAWSRYVRQEQLDGLLAEVHGQGREDYRAFPPGPREHYLLIDYISPLDWRNRRVLGFDMLSEPVRLAAIEQAIVRGEATLSAPVTLRQETQDNVQGGVLLYLPVYRVGMPLATLEERRAALLGMVHGAFRSQDLMEGILGALSRRFDVSIKDLQAPETLLLSDPDQVPGWQPTFRQTLELPLYGRNWVLEVSSTAVYEAALLNPGSHFSLWAGLVAAVLLALLVGGYLHLRERELHASQQATAQLGEREERFRLLVERLPVATLLCSADGRIEMANHSAAELLGCTAQQLLGERVRRFLPAIEQLSRLVNDQGTAELSDEYHAHRDSGGEVPVTLSLSMLGDSAGVNYLLNLVDLRARKGAEERFRLVVEASPNAIVLVDSSGRIAMVNRQTEQMFGYERQELVGQPVEKLLPEAQRGGHVGLRSGYQERPEPRRMGNNRELFGQHRDGRLIPLEVGLSPMRSGQESWVQAVIIDISERKAAEQRFRLVVEASPNAIVLVDSDGKIAMVNQQTEQMFGYEREALVGQAVEKLLPEAKRGSHVGLRSGYQENPEPRRMGNNRELFGQHRDGRLIPLEVGLSPIHGGEQAWVQAVIIDISERKAAEQRLRDQAEQLILANRYKSEFLANMSHELRTPLNSILILSDQLRLNSAGNLTEKQTRHADIVHRAGSDLLQLINDVLDLAKVESGRMQLKLEALNMQDVLVELDASMRPMAELKGLHLHTRQEPGVPRLIRSDRVRLQQILRNLLSNALKFTERGEVSLVVACTPCEAGDGVEWLSFSVRDSGIGIAAEQHEQIFQAFQQIDGSTSRRFGGTGLGLAITRQLVLAMDGEISLQSAPGQGSCFTVRLPVQMLPVSEALPAAAGPQRGGQGPAVLIVEDDDNFAAVLAEQAQAHGFTSVHCRTGMQALNLLHREQFSAVILDILLPDVSGWQLFRRLRGQTRHRHTPVHIISCVPQPADWNDDGTRYLVKPIQREDLEQVFVDLRHLDQSPAQRLLLVEDVQVEREHYREHLQRLGFAVHACARADEALQAYSAGAFSALVVDLDLPDQDGFELLQSLDRQRPLNGTRVVINTGVDVTHQALQRLRRYSAVVVHKHGEDMQALSQAVQGFLGGVRAPQSPAPQLSEQALQGRRVLLVDDDVRNVYALTALLDEVGLRVIAARDGLEAIASYQREPCDLILMDMAMPNMDGYTATRLLKSEHGCGIPIIALTAHAMKGDREKCIAAGSDDYLAKPVSRDALLGMLGRWLASRDGLPVSSAPDDLT